MPEGGVSLTIYYCRAVDTAVGGVQKVFAYPLYGAP